MQAEGERRRRRQWSAEEKRDLLERWKASGLGAQEFAAREGVARHNLFRWRRSGEPRVRKPRSTVTFTPVKVLPSAPRAREDVASTPGLALEVELPSGVRVRVYRGADVRAAKELLGALFGRRSC